MGTKQQKRFLYLLPWERSAFQQKLSPVGAEWYSRVGDCAHARNLRPKAKEQQKQKTTKNVRHQYSQILQAKGALKWI